MNPTYKVLLKDLNENLDMIKLLVEYRIPITEEHLKAAEGTENKEIISYLEEAHLGQQLVEANEASALSGEEEIILPPAGSN